LLEFESQIDFIEELN